MSVKIRELKQEDLAKVKEFVVKMWGVEGVFSTPEAMNAAGAVFVNMFLQKGSFGRVATENGEVIGVILASVKNEEPRLRMLMEDPFEPMAVFLQLEETERQLLAGYFHTMLTSYERLLTANAAQYDGCLELFIVDEKARGKHVGTKLMHELRTYFQQVDVKDFYLFTDTRCNYGYYDHNGFMRRVEDPVELPFSIAGSPFCSTTFLYDYSLA